MYEYAADYVRTVDGDTVVLNVDLGFRMGMQKEHFRLFGINAPEITRGGTWDEGLTEEEIEASIANGKRAKEQVHAWLSTEGASIVIKTVKDDKGKYGRYLAHVYVQFPGQEDPFCVNQELVAMGFAEEKEY